LLRADVSQIPGLTIGGTPLKEFLTAYAKKAGIPPEEGYMAIHRYLNHRKARFESSLEVKLIIVGDGTTFFKEFPERFRILSTRIQCGSIHPSCCHRFFCVFAEWR
jgi:hypothetical protein